MVIISSTSSWGHVFHQLRFYEITFSMTTHLSDTRPRRREVQTTLHLTPKLFFFFKILETTPAGDLKPCAKMDSLEWNSLRFFGGFLETTRRRATQLESARGIQGREGVLTEGERDRD